MFCRKVLLTLNSNVAPYRLTISDGCQRLQQVITSRLARLCLYTNATCLQIHATPLSSGYQNDLHFCVSACSQTEFSLYLNFPQTIAPTPPVATNTFTLTDRNYGLPIDGTLTFLSV